MEKVHSKKVAIVGSHGMALHAATSKPNTKLHFRLEIIGTKASAAVWGNATEIANGICSAMGQMPQLAKVILEAAVYFTNQPQEEVSPKTQE